MYLLEKLKIWLLGESWYNQMLKKTFWGDQNVTIKFHELSILMQFNCDS